MTLLTMIKLRLLVGYTMKLGGAGYSLPIIRSETASASAVTEQGARCCACALAVAESFHPIDKDVSIPVGMLDSPPFTARQIVNGFTDPFGFDGQLF